MIVINLTYVTTDMLFAFNTMVEYQQDPLELHRDIMTEAMSILSVETCQLYCVDPVMLGNSAGTNCSPLPPLSLCIYIYIFR